MSIPLQIQGTTINFPESSASPNWSPGIIQFAQATATALSGLTGPFDVSPFSFILTSDVNTNVNLTNLNFPTTSVRSAIITYNIERVNSSPTTTQYETGLIEIVYNGTTWDMTRDSTGQILNGSSIPFNTFSITNLGQVQFSTITLGAGTFTSGKITYSAKALSN